MQMSLINNYSRESLLQTWFLFQFATFISSVFPNLLLNSIPKILGNLNAGKDLKTDYVMQNKYGPIR